MDMDEKAERYEQLTAYLDGELSEDDRREVESLLERDADARKLLAELRETSRLVAELPRASASSELTASIMGRLERRELLAELEAPRKRPPRIRSLEWMRPLGVAAGLAIICTASWLVYSHTETAARKQSPGDAGVAQVSGSNGSGPAAAPDQGAEESPIAARRLAKGEGPGQSFGAGRGGQRATEEKVAAAPPPAADSEESNRLAMQATRTAGGRASEAPNRDAAKPAEPSGTTLGQPYREMADAAGRPSPAAAGRKLDDSLAANALKADGVLNAGFDEFSNRIVLQTDQYTTQEIMARVRHFMLLNEVPDLGTAPPDKPVSATQTFYAMNVEQLGDGETAEHEERPPWAPVRVVANLPVGDAAELVETMQRVTRRRQDAQWTANSQPLSGRETADELAGLLVASADKERVGEESLRQRVVKGEAESPGTGTRFEDAKMKKGHERTQARRAVEKEHAGGDVAMTTTAPATQPMPRDNRFVTLAILLTPPTAPPPSAGESLGKNAPASSPATTQPAKKPIEDVDDRRP